MDDTSLFSFGRWIKRRRRALDLTQEALAALVGCSKELIVKIEGDARRPSREIAALLADRLQLPVAERDAFIRCARAQRSPDQLRPPTGDSERAAFMPERGNLPCLPNKLVGRTVELTAILALLRAGARLVTLTGSGGIGKTRLALRVVAELAGEYADGVWFVDLAPVIDPAQALAAIAHTLGLPEIGDQSRLATLKAYLRGRHILLLLDNLEQIIDAAAEIAALLAAAPGLTVLATSRASLRLTGEHEYVLPPLATPAVSEPLTLVQVTQYDAVRLFIDRARAARPAFQITDANAPAIAEICARLDGLPLAIELAAARVRMFSPAGLLERLECDGGLGILTGGSRDHPARQQTIRATIAWSERLLSPPERELLLRLAIFVGGWTLEGALAVGMTTGDDADAILDRLEALVDHHLVTVGESISGEPRYGMLELVRQYALEQLRLAGMEQEARRGHAAFLYQWLKTIDPASNDPVIVGLISRERANLNAALAWSLDAGGADGIYALQIIGAVWEYWFYFAQDEGGVWIRRALAILEQYEAGLYAAPVLNAAARVLPYCGDRIDALALLRQSLDLARRDGDRTLEAEVLRHHGEYLTVMPGCLDQARQYTEASLALCRESGDQAGEFWNMVVLGYVALRAQRLDEATQWLEASLARCANLHLASGPSAILRYLAEVAERRGNLVAAEAYVLRAIEYVQSGSTDFSGMFSIFEAYLAYLRRRYEVCLALLQTAYHNAEQYGQTYFLLAITGFQATVHLVRDDLPGAIAAVRRVLELQRRRPRDPAYLVRTATVAARVALAQSCYPAAARLLAAIARIDPAIAVGLDDQPDPALERWRDEDARACRAALGEAAFAAAWRAGQDMALEQAIEDALGIDVRLCSEYDNEHSNASALAVSLAVCGASRIVVP